MNVSLKFDYHSCIIYIPDGYVYNFSELQLEFFDWLYDRSDCMIENHRGNVGVSYNEDEFLLFVNEVILKNSTEKAYIYAKSKGAKNIQYELKF